MGKLSHTIFSKDGHQIYPIQNAFFKCVLLFTHQEVRLFPSLKSGGALWLFQPAECSASAAMCLLDWIITAMLLLWSRSSEILTLWTVPFGMCREIGHCAMCIITYVGGHRQMFSQYSQLSSAFGSNQPRYQPRE